MGYSINNHMVNAMKVNDIVRVLSQENVSDLRRKRVGRIGNVIQVSSTVLVQFDRGIERFDKRELEVIGRTNGSIRDIEDKLIEVKYGKKN